MSRAVLRSVASIVPLDEAHNLLGVINLYLPRSSAESSSKLCLYGQVVTALEPSSRNTPNDSLTYDGTIILSHRKTKPGPASYYYYYWGRRKKKRKGGSIKVARLNRPLRSSSLAISSVSFSFQSFRLTNSVNATSVIHKTPHCFFLRFVFSQFSNKLCTCTCIYFFINFIFQFCKTSENSPSFNKNKKNTSRDTLRKILSNRRIHK